MNVKLLNGAVKEPNKFHNYETDKIAPSNEERAGLGAWPTKKKQKIQTPYFRTYSRRA